MRVQFLYPPYTELPLLQTPGPGAAEAARSGVLDIMAQQLKFIGCLQLMMEELSNLASGLGVDGGQLRYQLYLWLERQVDALIDVCNYDGGTVDGECCRWWVERYDLVFMIRR